jgi:hypothetical protein
VVRGTTRKVTASQSGNDVEKSRWRLGPKGAREAECGYAAFGRGERLQRARPAASVYTEDVVKLVVRAPGRKVPGWWLLGERRTGARWRGRNQNGLDALLAAS